MEKSKFNFKKPENVVLEIDGQNVVVRPYLELNEMVALINNYLDEYFHPDTKSIAMDEWNLYDAEFSLKMAIVDFVSSIPVAEGSFENLFYSNLYDIIEAKIVNYWDFRELLDKIVDNIKESIAQKKSVGGIIDSLYEKGKVILDQLVESTKNLTPEQLEKLKETGKELVDKIAQNPIVGEVFKDAERGK